ncbi:winged helix-turn-helix domain-containing protein [Paenarthrobacter sp. NPDC057355]|uniref:winged helix-turn-helix domain-containing protein n=1 Tax=Paenarthrobacter sp. NPDC057355 TaxID=3346105 RepID=UPI00363B34BF
MPRVASDSSPAGAWAALAPLLAGQPRVRLSRDGGKTYPQKHERDLTERLPTFPAAVRIFGKDGTCRAIFLDFDSSVAGIDWVEADVRAVQSWLYRCGARWIEDFSPNGGRHVYIPLAERVTFSQARDLVEALGTRYRSLDKSPHQNLNHGCMRVPGSLHKRGGHQQLAMSLNAAYDVVRRPNSSTVWRAMTGDLAQEIAAARALRLEQSFPATVEAPEAQLQATAAQGRMSRAMAQLAVSGLYDANRYATDSEARQAVLVNAAAAGLSLVDVQRRLWQGHWPGLASLYARYGSQNRSKSIQRDWTEACRYVKENKGKSGGKNNAHISHTSQPLTQGGATGIQGIQVSVSRAAEHQYIRVWRNALRLLEHRYQDSRDGQAKRMILRALGEAAHMTDSRFIEFGCRSIAEATGLSYTTVAAHLRELRQESRALITQTDAAVRTKADQYLLTIPEDIREAAEDLSWQKGKIHALRPVFRELGIPAAFVYEALEQAHEPQRQADIIRQTRLSRTAVEDALQVMVAWNMITRDRTGAWTIVASTSLKDLAEYFGVLEAVADQHKKHKNHREQWKAWLGKRAHTFSELLSPTDDYPWDQFEGPPDEWTLADIAFTAAG